MPTIRHINAEGLKIIQDCEGLRLEVYRDPIGLPTVGWGHMDRRMRFGDKITLDKAQELLKSDLLGTERAVSAYLSVPLTDNQFSALVSFAFNVGGWRSSTLFKLLSQKKYVEAADEFPKWCHAGGKVLDGLLTRRKMEQSLFLKA